MSGYKDVYNAPLHHLIIISLLMTSPTAALFFVPGKTGMWLVHANVRLKKREKEKMRKDPEIEVVIVYSPKEARLFAIVCHCFSSWHTMHIQTPQINTHCTLHQKHTNQIKPLCVYTAGCKRVKSQTNLQSDFDLSSIDIYMIMLICS